MPECPTCFSNTGDSRFDSLSRGISQGATGEGGVPEKSHPGAKSFILISMQEAKPGPKVEIGRWDERVRSRPEAVDTPLGQLEALAWILDSSIPVPGTRCRVGLDAVIGLVPVVGDIIGAALSTYILFMASRQGVPRVTLLRMGFNITLEAVVGLIPIAGDLFDFAWKANRRNVELLRAHIQDPARARKGDAIFAAGFMLIAVAVLGLLAWGGFLLGRKLWGLFAS